MEEIIVLIDYKSSFGSKFNASPPYSGLDLKEFSIEMEKFGYKIVPTYFFDVDYNSPNKYSSKKILYQSSEANDGYAEYKSHIDDVLYFLKISGAHLIPDYKYFKSHSNKFFMEILRGFMDDKNKPSTSIYGSLEDFKLDKKVHGSPIVIKKSHGAQAKGVYMAKSSEQLSRIVKKVSKSSFTLKEYIKERLRKIKHKTPYIPFSIHRNKFILQSFTEGLSGDFKVLVFNDIFYLIKRDNRPNDFRASGGGLNTFTGEFELPEGLLDYAYTVFENFKCPYVSLDIGVNKDGFHLIEFQFINFGTSAHYKSKIYYQKKEDIYNPMKNDLSLEYLYSYSLNSYLK